ncbi:MAG TPA: carboxylating nicotinate-nucleotide diphosphorylase [bacterium]
MSNRIFDRDTKKAIAAALAEDIGKIDLSSFCIPKGKKIAGLIIAGEDFLLAGVNIAKEVFKQLDRKMKFRALSKDGEWIKKKKVIAAVSGDARSMLSAERTALNFLQHLSGIATNTKKYIRKAGAKKVIILDTRKTTPGLRRLEKYATRIGGAVNHRMGLYDRILIKENHIRAAGGIRRAIDTLKKKFPGHTGNAEAEVRTIDELKEALECGVRHVLLDNMRPGTIKKAAKIAGGRAKIEVSGGVSLQNIGKFASQNVDFISVGRLTHAARWVDISFQVK